MNNKYFLKIFLILLSFIFSTIVLAKTGGSITIVQGPEPVSLDPSIDINKTSINVQYTMFDPLINNNVNNNITPWLAESWKTVSPKQWRFSLRKNVYFHNNEKFNAESVKFSINVYQNSKGEGSKFFKFIERVEVVDEYTVDIFTKTVNPIVPRTMAFLHILPPKHYSKLGPNKFSNNPVGTGPVSYKHLTLPTTPYV